jgi:hypothetical protein
MIGHLPGCLRNREPVAMITRTLLCLLAFTAGAPFARAQAIDWTAVEAAMGRSAITQPSDVHRFNFPRTDLQVVVGSVRVKPALARGLRAALDRTNSRRTTQ